MGNIKKAVSGLVDALGDVVEGVTDVVVTAAKQTGETITRGAEFALALKPLVEANGGRLQGDELRGLLAEEEAPGLEQTLQRRARFIEKHGDEPWNRHLEAVKLAETSSEGIRVESGSR